MSGHLTAMWPAGHEKNIDLEYLFYQNISFGVLIIGTFYMISFENESFLGTNFMGQPKLKN